MRCANHLCDAEMTFLRTGSLHVIDIPFDRFDHADADKSLPARRFIWLCDPCSQLLVLETWRPPGEQLRFRHPGSIPGGTSHRRRMQPNSYEELPRPDGKRGGVQHDRLR